MADKYPHMKRLSGMRQRVALLGPICSATSYFFGQSASALDELTKMELHAVSWTFIVAGSDDSSHHA